MRSECQFTMLRFTLERDGQGKPFLTSGTHEEEDSCSTLFISAIPVIWPKIVQRAFAVEACWLSYHAMTTVSSVAPWARNPVPQNPDTADVDG